MKGFYAMAARPVRKAVFPVGGLGTRFLPATKAVPKEMLPVVDRPLLQYAVESALEDYFDVAGELVATLKERGKNGHLVELEGTQLAAGNIAYVRQQEPLG